MNMALTGTSECMMMRSRATAPAHSGCSLHSKTLVDFLGRQRQQVKGHGRKSVLSLRAYMDDKERKAVQQEDQIRGFQIANFKDSGMVRRCTDKDLNQWNQDNKQERLNKLESQLTVDVLRSVALFRRPILTSALIAGDMVLMDILYKQRLLDKIPVVFIDTMHLFPETYEFLDSVETHYDCEVTRFTPEGCKSKDDWDRLYTSDLHMTDPETYDNIAKVEPLQRALSEIKADAWINGRRRDHGFDRGSLPVYEAGNPVKIHPLAFWTFEDCWDYINKHNVPYHPLHDHSYPSVGDMHSTVPVFDKKKWFEYGGERSGRFQGSMNEDGSMKTIDTFSEASMDLTASSDFES